MAEETSETCPECGTPRPDRLGYCRQCEYVFEERRASKEKIISRFWFSTWLFYLLVHFIGEYNRIHFTISFLIVGYICWVAQEFQPGWTHEDIITNSFWLIGLIPIPLAVFLFILSFTCSRKVIRISDVWNDTIVTTDKKGNSRTRKVQIIDTDLGRIEGRVGQFDKLEPGKSYRCWYGEKFGSNQPFVCEPFEPVYVEPR